MLVLAALMLPAGMAMAAEKADNCGAQALASGNYAKAEMLIAGSLKKAPADPVLLLNLARVYDATDRAEQGRALYARVLSRQDVQLETLSGAPVWSHALANARLKGDARVASLILR
jgi:thioredoxin-like negative regulator of GroEL